MTTLSRRAALKNLLKGAVAVSAALCGLNVSDEQTEAERQANLSVVFFDEYGGPSRMLIYNGTDSPDVYDRVRP